ncbi:TonB-dependent receptor [Elongatibacter sediminis]|uniref:TonB-dependent receptor n=1 Tax=Elongatibacter sediminis TaxID=3119006 RepID=A0AAW9RCZ5_9GAMM
MKHTVNHMMSLALASVVTAPLTALPAQAQEQAAGALEEIIVTAQRREQSLQEVPVSITAFTAEQLERANIREASQYLNLSPNVSYTEDGQQGGSRGISISMRGVSNINTDESAFIQSVGIYLDEFSVASTANVTLNPQLLDLARVEVLRGPQGTYFGRNAVGGALNLTTKKPTDTFEGSVRLGARSFDNAGEQYDVGVVLNAPVTENFFLRGVAYYEDSSGLVENIVPNGGDSGHEYSMFRGSARWLASEDTTVDFMVMYSQEDQGLDEAVPSGVWDTDSVATFFLNDPNDPNRLTFAPDDGIGFWPNNRNQVAHTAIDERNEFETTIAVLNVSHSFSDTMSLKWITGLIDTEREKVFDNDLVPEDLVRRYESVDGSSWSSELRLEITNDQYDWVVGALYSDDKIEGKPWDAPGGGIGVVTGVTTGLDTGIFLGPVPGGNPDVPITGPGLIDFALTGALPPLFNLGSPEEPFFLYNLTPDGMQPLCLGCGLRRNELESYAIFTDYTWHASDQLDITVGARYTHDEVFGSYTGFGLFRTPRIPDPSDPSGLTPVSTTNKKTFEDIAPRFSVGYQVNDDARIYGTISKGYKAGGFTLGFNSANGEEINETFNDEVLWNYEVGFKTEWFDNRLRVNGSLFYLEWSDLQLETFFFAVPGDASSNIAKTINVRDAEAKGFELEFAAAPTENLTLTGGIGVLDTEITSNDTARLSGNLTVSLEGEPLPRSPEFSANFAAEYRWPLGANEAFIRGEYIYLDSQFSTIEDVTYLQTSNQLVLLDPLLPATPDNVVGQIPDRSDGFPFKTPSTNLFHLRGGVTFGEGWELTVFVENVFDEEYYTSAGDNFGLSGFRLKPHPRVIGGTISYNF